MDTISNIWYNISIRSIVHPFLTLSSVQKRTGPSASSFFMLKKSVTSCVIRKIDFKH